MIHQIERLDLLHNRTDCQPAAVCVAGERPAERETVGAGLLLDDAPPVPPPSLQPRECALERRPLDPAFDRDLPARGIEADDARERAGVDEYRPFTKLLASHRVPPTGDRDRDAAITGHKNCTPKLGESPWRDDGSHPRRIELSVDVVDDDGGRRYLSRRSQAQMCDGRCLARDGDG